MGRQRQTTGITTTIDSGIAAIEPDPGRGGSWLLKIDGTQQSAVDLDDPTHLEFEYVRRIGHIIDDLPPGRVRAVHLGGGALTLPRYICARRPGSANLVIEVDAALVQAVRTHLPWPRKYGIRVRISDARSALETLNPGMADLLVSDVFANACTPGNLTTTQSFVLAARSLAPDGVFVANIADQAPLDFARSFVAGVSGVFSNVVIMVEPAIIRGRRYGNLVVLAGERDLNWMQLANRCAGDPWPARVVQGSELRSFIGDHKPFDDSTAIASPPPPPGAFG